MKSTKSLKPPSKRKLLVLRRISGDSMLPGLKPGSLIIGWGLFRHLRVGHIVIINHNGLEKIKRIAKIEDNQLYLLGDNPNHSTDSRHWGWLPISNVSAIIIWPNKARTSALPRRAYGPAGRKET